MAYLLTHFWPRGTEEQYRKTLATVTEAAGGGVPSCSMRHCPTDGGFLIVGAYDSKETSDRFVHDAIMSVMPMEGGLVGPPKERAADVVYSEGLSGWRNLAWLTPGGGTGRQRPPPEPLRNSPEHRFPGTPSKDCLRKNARRPGSPIERVGHGRYRYR
jgi:hypothetical protein